MDAPVRCLEHREGRRVRAEMLVRLRGFEERGYRLSRAFTINDSQKKLMLELYRLNVEARRRQRRERENREKDEREARAILARALNRTLDIVLA